MSSAISNTRGRVLGIGGIFFKSAEKQSLENWYRNHLGIDSLPEQGAQLRWRSHDDPVKEYFTVWSVFPENTKYFDGQQTFMINYIVDDLDALLTKLQADGVKIDPKREDYDYGRFAWIYDADGNKVELWQPL